MSKKHSVIIVPGLGEETNLIRVVTKNWEQHHLEPIIYSIHWHSNSEGFKTKLDKLLNQIDKLHDEGKRVSLVGASAGGSAVINAFIDRKEVVHKVVSVCGRLKIGPNQGFRSFKARTSSSPSFADSVKLAVAKEKQLIDEDRARIMTVRAMFGDELVPARTATINGAYNTQVPTPEHVFSIAMALTLFSKPIITFLKC